MASTRTPTRVRPHLLAVAAAAAMVAALAVLPGVAGADPGQPPQPTVASVTTKLDGLARQNEALTEQYNLAQSNVGSLQRAADAARRDAAQAAAGLAAAQVLLNRALTEQYEGSAFSTAGALLTSQSGQSYLDKLTSLGLLSVHRADMVADLKAAKAKAQAAQQAAATKLAQAEAALAAIGKQRDQIVADTARFKALLATLTAAQQQAYRMRNVVANTQAQAQARVAQAQTQAQPQAQAAPAPSPAPSPAQASTTQVHAGNAAAQKAVNFALAQVGKAYVFAASGPDAFDCSGLTMAAWAQAGVSLPHFAATQYNYGTHVTADQLQPGDLIFLYQPISHVEIYIGNGQAVSAADEAEGIVIVNIARDMSDWAGATRLS